MSSGALVVMLGYFQSMLGNLFYYQTFACSYVPQRNGPSILADDGFSTVMFVQHKSGERCAWQPPEVNEIYSDSRP